MSAPTPPNTMLDTAMKQTATCVERPGFRHHKKENYVCQASLSRQSTEGSEEVTQLRKLNGSPIECPSHQNLHKELLLSHKRGLLLEEKPELQRVLEQRRLEQHREQELALRPPSDLEQELRKRQQRLLEYEMEEMKRREGQENVPEFVRVKEKLRHIEVPEQNG
ncbi:protein FAM107B isoform X1 [Pygocentrus nattereri]|uniref:Family with sequence similarity 107 member A n=1 Tax=Pygocentrus nattereri TaxID=42514 RepID=A0A3B4CLK9_PYGNA|nr:protein FAM107B isoform X1 [Pygocentrus nattereri]